MTLQSQNATEVESQTAEANANLSSDFFTSGSLKSLQDEVVRLNQLIYALNERLEILETP